MRKSRAAYINSVLVALLAGALLPQRAAALTSLRQCRSACLDEIAACTASGGDRIACRRASLQRCREVGLGACVRPDEPATPGGADGGGLLETPENLNAGPISSSQILLTWDGNRRLGRGYIVERSLDATVWAVIGGADPGDDRYRDGDLAGGTRYFYRLRMLGRRGGLSEYSGVVSATTLTDRDLVPPAAPAQVTATPVGCHQVDVDWSPANDGTGSGVMAYDVYRNGNLSRRVMAPDTSVSETGVAEGTDSSYAVVAVDHAGNRSAMSPRAFARTPACPTTSTTTVTTTTSPTTTRPPTTTTTRPPTTTTTVAPTTTTTTASPTTSTSTSTSSTSTRPPTTTTTTASTTTSTRPTTTSTTTATTTRPPTTTTTTTIPPPPPDNTPPSVPGGVSATPANCTQMTVGWNASGDTGGSGLRGYRVYRDGALAKQVFAPATSASDTGLAGGTIYGYQVSAFDNAGNESGRSAMLNANTPACPDTTPPSVPGNVQATAASCSRIDVSWTASTDTGGSGVFVYNVYRNGSFWRQVAASSTSTADSGLAGSTSAGYAVSAVDVAGNESQRSAGAATTTPPCAASSPELVAFIPAIGGAKDVVLDGNGFAWIASTEFGLSLVDVRTPSRPVAVAATNPPFYGEHLAMDGGVACVTSNGGGLKVIDLSDTSAPSTVGALAGTMPDVAMAGRYAYILFVVPGNPSHTDLVTVDLVNPAAPAIVGRVTLGRNAYDLQLVGTLAYVAAGTDGLLIVDVRTPNAPAIVGTEATSDAAQSVTVANGMAYVGTNMSLVTVDVRNPGSPATRGSVATPVLAAALSGTRLYALGGAQFKVIDVANPAAPALLSTSQGYSAQRVAAAGSTAFLASADVDASRNMGGLYVVDVSTPTAPRYVTNSSGRFENTAIDIAGSRAVITGNALGLKVIDLSNPLVPQVLGSLGGTMASVAMSGQYAYVLLVVPGNPGHVDLIVVDVSGTPSIVGRTTLADGKGIDVVGSLAYVAAGAAGLQVVDVGNPAAPRSVGIVDTAGTATAVSVLNGYAYVADWTGFVVVDVSSPSQPAIRGSLPSPATAVAVAGSRAFILGGNQLKAVDVANPAAPALLSAVASLGQGIDLSNGMAFVATPALNHFDPNGGVTVFDVTDPRNMRLLKRVIVPGTTRTMRIAGGRAYAGDSASTIDVIELR